MAKTIIEATTSTKASDKFNINLDYTPVLPADFDRGIFPLGTTFRVTGGALGTDEYVKLRYHDGTDWQDANIEGDEGKILDADNAVATIYGRMTDIRVEKSVTANALGVEVV